LNGSFTPPVNGKNGSSGATPRADNAKESVRIALGHIGARRGVPVFAEHVRFVVSEILLRLEADQ
jgi:hypothetical protein